MPDAPKNIDKKEYYVAKFGEARTAAIFERMTAIGKEEGINFKYGGRTGNTRDSHRLIQLGKKKSPQMQTRVIEELFAAYFENEKDITSQDVLVETAVKAGLDKAEAQEWLSKGKGGSEVDAEVQDAYRQNIHGVPNYTINDQYEIGGAQEPATFLELFERIKRGAAGGVATGNTC
ncbi:thioredoxin-like protein [Periconia macrospinosa]|uniref:Thioredoxin-like protein n=1 Tax=Periconia macrospinosa TaxID=97972 RepID=A0A2V1DMH9_9PLEO|nr:thioredoxin-like protein [Periconia macrospinosa]